jgi:hypothetical protein
MSEILAHRSRNNASFGFKPRDTRMQSMGLQAYESPDSQADRIALGDFKAALSTFDTGELLETPVVDFHLPGIQCEESGFFNAHIQLAGSPVFCVAVCTDCPEDLDTAIHLEMHQTTFSGNENLPNGAVSGAINTDFSIALEVGQPGPVLVSQQLEIGQSTVPAVKSHYLRLKTMFSRLLHHHSKMIVFAQTILGLIVDPKIDSFSPHL